MNKPSIPKGTRDFLPAEMAKRNYIFNTIKEVYELYGFQQIETPAIETLQTLMGKYGEEGDKLLFKILNSGNFTNKIEEVDIKQENPTRVAGLISEKGLRYDLTVPFARFVVMHKNDIQLPFKRYQIQPVWRADRPQKGRYREFYQCDADIVGSESLLNEVELIQIIDNVFTKLGINVQIKINNRKILSGIAVYIGEQDKIIDITIAIDKIEKIGIEGVNEELSSKGISKNAIEKLQPILKMQGGNNEKLDIIEKTISSSCVGIKGIEETKTILNFVKTLQIKNEIQFDLTLARGLNYYTGTIFEVKALDVNIGSITGGGRYDNLTGIFGMPGISGVGISFGADRIYDVLNTLKLYPDNINTTSNILFINFGEKETAYCLPIIQQLRKVGINIEIYPDMVKMKKQMAYANSKHIPFVALAGESEIKENKITLKNMITGEQNLINVEQLINIITKKNK